MNGLQLICCETVYILDQIKQSCLSRRVRKLYEAFLLFHQMLGNVWVFFLTRGCFRTAHESKQIRMVHSVSIIIENIFTFFQLYYHIY